MEKTILNEYCSLDSRYKRVLRIVSTVINAIERNVDFKFRYVLIGAGILKMS